MGRIFDEAMGHHFGSEDSRGAWLPVTDIYETKKHIILKVELAGIDIEDVDLEVDENKLTITGERRPHKGDVEEHYHAMECSYGGFQRIFELPGIIDKDKIKANFKDGVLEVKAHRKEKSKPKHIKVEVK
ncbi:MAG: Hsp20/alpha crystallin family protein [Deltaproteobacteria bacterium]|nr:Hsp20/alpha crystallin family protein [Deltaproteobacteria bacterium]